MIVIGAPVFRDYPSVGGDYVPKGTHLLQVTDDPNMSSKAPVGDSLVSDARLFLEAIQPLVKKRASSTAAPLRAAPNQPDMEAQPLAGEERDAVLVEAGGQQQAGARRAELVADVLQRAREELVAVGRTR